MRPVIHYFFAGFFSVFGAADVIGTPALAVDAPQPASNSGAALCTTANTVKADIVALEQAYLLNRFSSYVPAGMLYALRRDVVPSDGSNGELKPGKVMLRADKRPRPLVLRVNAGDCLEVSFTNLLAETRSDEGGIPRDHEGRLPAHVGGLPGSSNTLVPATKISIDMPSTRAASFHVTGLSVVPIPSGQCKAGVLCGGDGSNVGLTSQQGTVFKGTTPDAVKKSFGHGSLAMPGQTIVTRWAADSEGAYFAYSTAAPVGGEGDGGQIGLGLFAAVNVEPKGSRWYRSQVTHKEIDKIKGGAETGRHPYRAIDYDAKDSAGGRPVLRMLDDANNLVHSDLNAIIVLNERQGGSNSGGSKSSSKKESKDSSGEPAYGSSEDRPFREFTVIFHDEVAAQQAFSELDDENSPLSQIRDGMGINYGVSSMGALMMGTPPFRKVGPAKDCADCRAEEFFLSSWANGDPALILAYDKGGKPTGARYTDDPSNVHHSYLGDPVRFRNIHAGPKETHVFHLHAHQWMQEAKNSVSSYLDSQTISPGATFSYDIEFGGSGNRNYTPGDSIFHCHLYPHFAQGMWELWRTHDAFVDGKPGFFGPAQSSDPTVMNLPDAEIATGTQSPAIVPIPGRALAPMPTAAFRGYPFYIPGQPGHRPPQPVLDMDVVDPAWVDISIEPNPDSIVNGGLPRHVVTGGTLKPLHNPEEKGGEAAQVIAKRVGTQNPTALSLLAHEWDELHIRKLNHSGEESERKAMDFHEGTLGTPGLTSVTVPPTGLPHPDWWPGRRAYRTDNAATIGIQRPVTSQPLFFVNGLKRAPGAPFANPCPDNAPVRDYRAAFIQTELIYNKHGWFDPQGRIIILENDIKDVIDPNTRTRLPEPLFFRANSGECINFKSSNFIPSALNVDDFQIFTPTDTIGQHIHLVKFDVTSSDGSGNGFNYEDATFSPEEVRERIFVWNKTNPSQPKLTPKPHPLFRPDGDIYNAANGDVNHPLYGALYKKGLCPPQAGQPDDIYKTRLNKEHPYCGAQRTTQRWWADPILNSSTGKDQTLRTVFTHDHLGPSSHQQHGLYAGLVIEPANSVWTRIGKNISTDDLLAATKGDALKCSLPVDDPLRSSVCDRLIGGSNLAEPTAASLRKPNNKIVGAIEPRPPMKLRPDGGPTATMANIIAPACFNDSDSHEYQPSSGLNRDVDILPKVCPDADKVNDTRREFALAIADFGIAYNMALEPINPEPRGESALRDNSAIRFGRRHVATTPARPLGISSEDPGSQYFNYRHEPLALRLSEATADKDDPAFNTAGGWSYKQADRRANLSDPCSPADQDCLGDPANGFSTAVHARRDEKLAKEPMDVAELKSTRDLLTEPEWSAKLDRVLVNVQNWRRDFNCMLYSFEIMGAAEGCPDRLNKQHTRLEPWRVFGDPATPILPVYEGDPVQIRLIQGSQEAQHIFTMNGVKWHRLARSGREKIASKNDENNTGYVNTQPLGISEHFEFDVNIANLSGTHQDYLYFGSSIDQLWDGLWGVMRSFVSPERGDPETKKIWTSAGQIKFKPSDFLAPIVAAPHNVGGDIENVCSDISPDNPYLLKAKQRQHRHFEISAVRVCDLFNDCDTAKQSGINYSERFQIKDERAIVYVLESEPITCKSEIDCATREAAWSGRNKTDTLAMLRNDFIVGRRPLEPLVMRAAAGQCLHVNLRNLLPERLIDGPNIGADGPGIVPDQRAYHNFLPMITDGFNINQFRTSSTVGLSAPRVAQYPSKSDGSNVGLNGASASRSDDVHNPVSPFERPVDNVQRQGSLVPSCPAQGPFRDTHCQKTMIWSAIDFKRKANGREVEYIPVEFGALPLRSFGDPIKHPAHGLVGALVIGPEGSEVCKNNRYAHSWFTPISDNDNRVKTGISADICVDGKKRYVDHTLIVQDAVHATRGGFPVVNLKGAEEPDDYGIKALNYRTDPLWARRGNDPSVPFEDRNEFDYSDVFSSESEAGGNRCRAGIRPLAFDPALKKNACDPETPVLTARVGETVRLNIVHPGGHTRQQGLALSGHAWNPYPWSENSRKFDSESGSLIRQGVYNAFGPMMGITLEINAGGKARMPMDYLLRSQASFLFDGGLWGLLRVKADDMAASQKR